MNTDRKFVSGSSDFLMHFGILGQKWGVRRFQNPDGTLTPEGRERYGKVLDDAKREAKYLRDENRYQAKEYKKMIKDLEKGHILNLLTIGSMAHLVQPGEKIKHMLMK